MLLVVAILSIACSECDECNDSFLLQVENLRSGEILLNLPVTIGDQFCIDYHHSVSGTPIKDTFRIDSNREIVLVEEAYQWSGGGGGLQTKDSPGVRVVSDGEWTKVILERHFSPYFVLAVGWVANHKLIVNGKTIPLLDIANAGEPLKFCVEGWANVK